MVRLLQLSMHHFDQVSIIIRVKMLSWKLQGGIEHWDVTDNIKLLEMLALDMETEDEEEIDWEGLVEEWERLVGSINEGIMLMRVLC